MARPIWKGSISFGLVNIPVGVHVAVREQRLHFRMLHASDKSPVKFTRVCAREDREVAWSELVKGYEYSKGRFVVLTKKDFEAAALEKTRRVDIIDFVKAEEIDDRFFHTPYYLVPEKSGAHAYALLREAMRQSRRIGIGKFVLRDVQHLAAVEVIDHALVLTLLRFADELADASELSLPSGKDVRKAELDMAKTLVENLAASWEPAKYKDDYRANLMRVIRAKAKGQKVDLTPSPEPRRADVVDLMERLRRSLERQRGAGGPRLKAAGKQAARRRSRRAA